MSPMQQERMQRILAACHEPKNIHQLQSELGYTANELYPALAVMKGGCLKIVNMYEKGARRYQAVPGASLPKWARGQSAETVVRFWTEEQDNFLRQHYATMHLYDLMEQLDRSKKAIWGRAKKLGLRKNGRSKSPEELLPKKRNGISENVGWLISFPTIKPQGATTVTFKDHQHSKGSPRKLSAWHGYSCEVMA